MNLEEDVEVVCPYCGAIFTAFVDTSAGGYATIEDCQVCCRPIELIVGCHAGVIDQVETARAYPFQDTRGQSSGHGQFSLASWLG